MEARHLRALGGVLGGLLCLVFFSGCLAQKADVKRMQGTFDRKFAELDRREKALAQKIEQAETVLAKQREESERWISEARARFKEDVRNLRNEELPKIAGEVERIAHFNKQNKQSLESLEHQLKSLTEVFLKQKASDDKKLGVLEDVQKQQRNDFESEQLAIRDALKNMNETFSNRLGEIARTVGTLDPALKSLAEKVDVQLGEQDKAISEIAGSQQSQGRTVTQHMTELRKKFGDYKEALETLSKQLVQQDGRIGELSAQMTSQTDQLRNKLESDIRNLTAHMATITTKVDSDIHGASSFLDQVNKKLEEDAQATAKYFAEVNKSVSSVAEALRATSAEVMARLDAHEARLNQAESHENQVTQSVATLAKSLEEVNASINARVEKQERRLDETARHVAEVNESVTSIAEAMRTLSQGVMERVQAQDERLKEAGQSLRDVQTQLDRISTSLSKQSSRGERNAGKSSSSGARSDARAPAASAGATDGAAAIGGRRARTDHELLDRQARERYEGLLATFMEGDLDRARQGFVEFLTKYPDSSRAPNAQYWLGECYYGKQQYVEAISAFDLVLLRYPESNKAPAALLKKGYAYLALNDRGQAKATLERVLQAFPNSQEARKASDRLHDLK